MENFDQHTLFRMDLALEEACRRLSRYGGDHESRKYVAKQLIGTAGAGKIGFEDLRAAAEVALRDLIIRRSA
ncbi:hypothetical protein JQ615_41450 [Bradyrhizobium jicamae]|uniref:Uncharacterized protein n=1 Tax=Bradyrhizobium jicamae TaxID=280332 RepID=A0ABS5FYF5_9BRAD|nr:hypothetical protein [Bradyrhizobium jicamae]MBR0801803.1 hypothetical protein [Bradyrhizobium jicamae]MBR0935772.1 hypothetical protein [Bradyrhizobium jicamae]